MVISSSLAGALIITFFARGNFCIICLHTLSNSAASTSPSVAGVQAGQMIEHERFGLGEVIKVEGTGDNAKATIHFKNAGDKQLLLRFARFKVVE